MNLTLSNQLRVSILNSRVFDDESSSKLYAVINASKDFKLQLEIESALEESAPLHSKEMDNIDPSESAYLMAVTCEDTLDWLLEDYLGRDCFVLITSQLDFDDLYPHCHRLTQIKTTKNETYYFHYYNPVSLMSYLPVLTLGQREFIFSKITSIVCEVGENHVFILMHDKKTLFYETIETDEEQLEVTSGSGVISPAEEASIDLIGAKGGPVLKLTHNQIEMPVLLNRPKMVQQIYEHLEEDYSTKLSCYPKGFAFAMISNGIDIAISNYSLTDVPNITCFIEFQWSIAPGFHWQGDIHKVLTNNTLSADEKLKIISDDRYANAWVHAMSLNQAELWFEEPNLAVSHG